MSSLKKSPFRLSAIVFLILTGTAAFFSYRTFQFAKLDEQSRAHELLDVAKNRLQQLLNYSTSATQLLAFLVRGYDAVENFESIAKNVFETQKYIDAIELVPNGVICCVYPMEGNESVIGYNILEDKSRNLEALEAITRNELYFAGPIELRQGGVGIVGRLPIVLDDEFWGFSAVLIKLETLIEATGLDTISNGDYFFGLSKINPNNGREEFFLSDSVTVNSGYSTDLIIHHGEWRLSATPKDKMQPIKATIPIASIGLILSTLGSFLVWSLVRMPILLSEKLQERSLSLKESELKYVDLYNQSPTMLMSVDLRDQRIIDCNDTFVTHTGYSRDEILQKAISEFYHPDSLDVARDAMHELLETGVSTAKEFKIFTRHGIVLSVMQSAASILNDNGQVGYVRYSWQDITFKKLVEKDLAESEDKFKLLAENINQVFYILNLESGKIEYISPAFERIWGAPIDKTGGFYDWIVEEDRDGLEKALEAQGRGEYSEVYYRIKRPKGDIRHIFSRGYPIKNEYGEGQRVAGFAEDVTESRLRDLVMNGEKRVLELIATGEPIKTVLNAIAVNFEKFSPGSICSILLLSYDGKTVHQGASPSLPQEFVKAIDGLPIGPKAGSCGTAAYLKKQVIVSDIENDPLWEDYKALALPLGLRACWSTPIISRDDVVMGTFAIYYKHVRSPGDFDYELIERASNQAKIALEKARTEESVKQSEQKFSSAFESNVVGLSITDLDRRIVEVNQSLATLLGINPEEMVGKTSEEAGILKVDFTGGKSGPVRKYLYEKGEVRNAECEIVMRDGKRIPVLLSISGISIEGKHHWLSTFIDISDRKKIENELVESENHIRTIIETEPECIMELDAHGNLISINPAGIKMIEAYGLEKVEGLYFLNIVEAEYRNEFKKIIGSVFNGDSLSFEYKISGLNGTVRWVEMNAVPLKDSRGQIISLLGITRDVTDRKLAEEDLLQSKAALELAEEYANLGNWEIDLSTGQARWSKQMFRMFGFDLDRDVPDFETYISHIHPDDKGIVEDAFHKMNKGIEPTAKIFRTNPETLALRYFKPTYFLVKDKYGKPVKFSGTVLDITTLQLREEALKASEKKYRTIFENTSEGIYRCTVEGELLLANPSFVQIFGYTSEEEMKSDVKDIGENLYAVAADRQRFLSELLVKGFVNKAEVKAKTRLGDTIWVSINAHLAYSVGKTIEYIEGTITDITERRLSLQKIDEQYEALRKYAFINSHEVRAHVATLLGLSNLFASENVNKMEKENIVELMQRETSALDIVIRKLSVIINEVE
ncbi:MAG: PAS domain S-box protein [Cyclobacteriaceae bacterium]